MEINQTKRYALIDIFGQLTGVYAETLSDAIEIAYDLDWRIFDLEARETVYLA